MEGMKTSRKLTTDLIVATLLISSLSLTGGQVLMEGSCPPIPVYKNFSPEKVSVDFEFVNIWFGEDIILKKY
jgi:hypothetical protein